MGTNEILAAQKSRILELTARHGLRNVRVFGSVARGQANSQSDVDLLVDVDLGRTYLDMGACVLDLEELLGRKVDLVTEGALHRSIREQILREAVSL